MSGICPLFRNDKRLFGINQAKQPVCKKILLSRRNQTQRNERVSTACHACFGVGHPFDLIVLRTGQYVTRALLCHQLDGTTADGPQKRSVL